MSDREMLEAILQKFAGIEADVAALKEDAAEIKTRLAAIHGQTAALTEDMTELRARVADRLEPKLDGLVGELAFLLHKQIANEKEIFHLQQTRRAQ